MHAIHEKDVFGQGAAVIERQHRDRWRLPLRRSGLHGGGHRIRGPRSRTADDEFIDGKIDQRQ